jgi:serine/threonine protein phosphatase PrpC
MSSPGASPVERSTEDFPVAGRPGRPRVRIEFGGLTHPGKVRANNEDHFLIARLCKSMQVCKSSLSDEGSTLFSEEEGYLMVVADGLGGAAAGERASALAVTSVEAFMLNTLQWFLHLDEKEEHELFRELREGLERADRTVLARARANPELVGMGSTLTMAYSIATDLYIAHVGDSRAYLYHDGELARLTTDHTLVQLLIEGGALSPEDAKKHKRRNVVTNVVGGPSQGVHAELNKLSIADGDVLLLCTDGLTEVVEDEKIQEVLALFPNAQETCRQLVELALSRGGPDNVTAVTACYGVS